MRDPELSGGEPSSSVPRDAPSEGSPVPSGIETPAIRSASDAWAGVPSLRVLSAAPRSGPLSAPRILFEDLPAVKIGIRVKLIALTVAVIVGIVVVLASYFVTIQIDDLRVARHNRAEVYADLAAHQLESSLVLRDRERAREALSALRRDPRVNGVALYTEEGALLHGEGQLSELAHGARGGFGGKRRSFYLPDRVLAIAPVAGSDGRSGTVVIEMSMRSVTEARSALLRAAFVVGALAVALGVLAAWFIARSLSRRIEEIAGAASAMAQGDLSQSVDVSGANDEIGLLGQGFNAMAKKLRELFEHVQRSAREESARLERLVKQRTAELDRKNKDLRLVLDNVEQGFVTVDRDAHVSGEYSRAIESWLGRLSPAETLWDALERAVPGSADRFGLGWEEVVAGILPLEVTLDQMPRCLVLGERHLSFEYKPLGGEDFEKLMVVITDVTATVARERSEREERDVLNLSSRLLNDRDGFLEFYAETQNLVQRVRANTRDLGALKRDLHTLKGNAAIFGLLGIANECHELEFRLDARDPETLDRSELVRQWEALCEKLTRLFGEGQHTSVQIDEAQYESLVEAIREGASGEVLERMVRAWRLDPVRLRLERLSAQLAGTAQRIGKGPVHVTVDAPAIYVAREELAEFWSVFAHVIRNAAAHGIEAPEVRASLGKPETAEFELKARLDQGRLYVAIADTGPGIDWEGVRAIARERGLPHRTEADLTNALFVDGVSTQSYVTDVSGRGVGLAAVRAVCERQGGRIEVASTRGKGTRFTFSWPLSAFESLVVLDADSRCAAE